MVRVPDTPGLGMDLDERKVEERRVLRWAEGPSREWEPARTGD